VFGTGKPPDTFSEDYSKKLRKSPNDRFVFKKPFATDILLQRHPIDFRSLLKFKNLKVVEKTAEITLNFDSLVSPLLE